MLRTGARPQEIRAVGAENVRTSGEDIVWYWARRKAPKGKHERTIWLGSGLQDMTRRLTQVNPRGPMFRNLRGHPWTMNALRSAVYRLGKSLGIPGLKPYTLRHTYATNALAKGISLEKLKTLMGHADIRTTQRYTHLHERHEEMQRAVSRL